MPAKLAPEHTRGAIIACGELRADPRTLALLTRILAHAAESPRIVLVRAVDGEDDDTELETLLYAAGTTNPHRFDLATRAAAENRELLDLVEQADLVVLDAVQPLRLSTVIGGTSLARLLRRRNASGMVVCGIGAGAAVLCEHMLAAGAPGPTPRMGGSSLAPGLGLTNRVVIDQGGHASDRLGRLLAALALNPFALGLGIDAATVAVIGPDNVLDVLGHGGVTLIDPSEMSDSNAAELDHGAPIRITNLRLHSLTAGARYDLDFRRAIG
ncbi:MAG TPA: cyanophycinase [Dokdonella sp.]|uniref:cyanophycinase n=1 Tax=Dokdonella sp. TaxID=2291710 RepID=UPI0025BD9739|nr:cyanophycinase [Dokdonella sp.]MBX3692720.1 cyanophycinase [Dokdonella sp.]MCW5567669.1 cyanophycinase [Dokdonella sp.]HNR91133.1 cyanophycinase [Dokdonella sp.]